MTEKYQKKFRLGTTSFIYPDHILPNVRKLGPFFDEIELLIFESSPATVLPSENEVKALLSAAKDLDLTYNVHLPTDISLTCDSPLKRQQAADMYSTVITRFAKLCPTTHTLHLEMESQVKQQILGPEKDRSEDFLKQWIENTYNGLKVLMANGINPDSLSIETLDYPFSLVEPLVAEFNLQVCMDMGHLVKYDDDLARIYQAHHTRLPVIHLHGVEFLKDRIKDHTRLDRMPEPAFKNILNILESYAGVVSIEVFNLENLNHSLNFLSRWFSIFDN